MFSNIRKALKKIGIQGAIIFAVLNLSFSYVIQNFSEKVTIDEFTHYVNEVKAMQSVERELLKFFLNINLYNEGQLDQKSLVMSFENLQTVADKAQEMISTTNDEKAIKTISQFTKDLKITKPNLHEFVEHQDNFADFVVLQSYINLFALINRDTINGANEHVTVLFEKQHDREHDIIFTFSVLFTVTVCLLVYFLVNNVRKQRELNDQTELNDSMTRATWYDAETALPKVALMGKLIDKELLENNHSFVVAIEIIDRKRIIAAYGSKRLNTIVLRIKKIISSVLKAVDDNAKMEHGFLMLIRQSTAKDIQNMLSVLQAQIQRDFELDGIPAHGQLLIGVVHLTNERIHNSNDAIEYVNRAMVRASANGFDNLEGWA